MIPDDTDRHEDMVERIVPLTLSRTNGTHVHVMEACMERATYIGLVVESQNLSEIDIP
jgi:hypothetical protein